MKFIVYLLVLIVFSGLVHAGDFPGIGRITEMDKKFWNIRINVDQKAEKSGIIHERDTIQTIAGQHLSILMEDGTELSIGPSSRVQFTNWSNRDEDHHRYRIITLETGLLKAKVKKVYSAEEPFIVASKNGAIAVRGTEFIAEAGSGGRLGNIRTLSGRETISKRNEIELHTLEGEVSFAKSIPDLKNPNNVVSVTAGQSSVMRLGMERPQFPHVFDVQKFQSYIAKAMPAAVIQVVKTTSNERRAEMASNSKQQQIDQISPAQPEYAKIKPKSNSTDPSGRALASSKTEAPESRRPSAAADKGNMVASKGDLEPDSDRIHDAFAGGEGVASRHAHDGLNMTQVTKLRMPGNPSVDGTKTGAPIRATTMGKAAEPAQKASLPATNKNGLRL